VGGSASNLQELAVGEVVTLSTIDLIQALKLFDKERYFAISVFADSLSSETLREIEICSLFVDEHMTYGFSVSTATGSVRLEHVHADAPAPPIRNLTEAISNAEKERGPRMTTPILGLLIGRVPNRVFALEFDPITRSWVSYGGGLLRWMKSRL